MIGRAPLMAILVLAAPGAALARPSHHDAHIRSVTYDPGQVVRIRTAAHRATEVALGPNQTIEHVAVGDPGAWEVAVAGGLLFLKPKPGAEETNLIVTTSGPAGERTYTFELTAPGAQRRGQGPSDYVVRVGDPAAAAEATQTALAAAHRALEAKITELRLDHGVLEGPRNLAYWAQGLSDLQPAEVSDNGRFTVLRFAGAQAIPAINTVDASGHEALARFDVRGEFVIVQGAWPGLRLRRGHDVLCLTNAAYRPDAPRPGGLTASPQVRRTDKEAAP